jgi:hypothetical protein
MSVQKPVYNAAGTHVFTTSPSGDEWECPVDYLPVALGRGFELTEPRDKSLDGLFDDSTAEGAAQTGFNPADHDVDEINAHLVAHLASPGEIVRVLELEAAGKNRKTVKDPRIPDPDADPGA